MSDLGNKNFLEEQTTVGGMGAYLDPEDKYQSIKGPFQQMMSQPSTVTSLSAQPMVSTGNELSSQGYRSRMPQEYKPDRRRGGDDQDNGKNGEWDQRDRDGDGVPDDALPFDVFAYDADDDRTWPQNWDEYNDWFHHYFVAQQEEMLQSLFALSGTNSISGLSGMLGAPGGFSTAEEYLYFMYMFLSAHPVLEGIWNDLYGPDHSGFCWGCSWFDDEVVIPIWPGYDYVPTWGGYGDPNATWSPENMYPTRYD